MPRGERSGAPRRAGRGRAPEQRNAERTIKGTYLDGSSGARAIGARSSDEVPVATFADAWSDSAWAEFCGAFG